MVRVIVAVVLTAVVQFFWGFAYFGVFNGMGMMTAHTPDEAAVADALAKALPKSGTYMLPNCPGAAASDADRKAHMERAKAGPIVVVHVNKAGFDMETQMGQVMGMGFGLTLVTAALAAFLLKAALPGLPTFLARFGFVAGLGLLIALATRMSDGIWFHHDAGFVLGQSIFSVTVWAVGGAVMAAIVRPAQQGAASAQPAPQPLAA
jgi:hypothetical protein